MIVNELKQSSLQKDSNIYQNSRHPTNSQLPNLPLHDDPLLLRHCAANHQRKSPTNYHFLPLINRHDSHHLS